jgi:hypothetical protein
MNCESILLDQAEN